MIIQERTLGNGLDMNGQNGHSMRNKNIRTQQANRAYMKKGN